MKKLLLLFLLLPFFSKAQTFTEKDTIVTVAPGITWKMTFRVNDLYYSRVGADSANAIWINFLGAGQSASNQYGDASMVQYGDIDAVHSGWDGGVKLADSIKRYPILVHISQQGPLPANVIARVPEAIRQVVSRFRVKKVLRGGFMKYSVSITGLSAGGATGKEGLMYDTIFARDYITSLLDVEGQRPDDNYNGAFPYPTRFASIARMGVRMWFIEGGNDGRDQGTQRITMNNAVPNSAIHTITVSTDPMYGHGAWNWVYGGNGNGTLYSFPHVFATADGNTDARLWRMRQGDTVIAVVGGNPIASAGADKLMYYTSGFTSLDGSGSIDPNGTITTYAWTKISGPTIPAVSFSNSAAAITNVSNLVQGVYVFRLTVTDNDANSTFDEVTVTVQAPPTVNAGPDQNISTSSSVFAAVSSDEGSVVKNIITKLKAPGQPLYRLGIIGSSTGASYGVNYDSSIQYHLTRFYKDSLGIIDTVINLSVISTAEWNALATGTPVNAGRPAPDTSKNLNALKRRGVTHVVSLFTTNGLDDPTLAWPEYYAMKLKERDSCLAMGMAWATCGPKTRETFSPTEEQGLKNYNDSLRKYFQPLGQFIDFWSGFTNGNTTDTRPEFLRNPPDGVHWGGLGYYQAARTIIAFNPFRNSVTSTSIITNPNSLTSTVTQLTSGAPHWFLVSSQDNDSLWNYDVVKITTSVTSPTTNNCRTGAPVIYTLARTETGGIYLPFGGQYNGHKGNDEIHIPPGDYDIISLGAIAGDFGCPVKIVNDGIVNVKEMRLGEKVISPVNHVHLTANPLYKFHFGGTRAAPLTSNALAASFFKHLEVDNLDVSDAAVGMYLKVIPDFSDPNTLYPAYTATGLNVHHNNLYRIHGEGMYIGHSEPYLGPARLDSVKIHDNTLDSLDWDGIQLSNARDGAEIYNNTVTHYGLINMGSQQAGIIGGGNTNYKIYNNIIRFGSGNGIESFGYGLNSIYNNTMEATGYDGTANGQQSIFGHDYLSVHETNPKQIDSVYNNTIIHPMVGLGVIRFNNDNGELLRASFVNNQICFTVTPPVGWETTYLQSGAPTTIRSGNTSISCGNNQPPIANAGVDITVVLPATSTTLVGSGLDVDGTVVSYSWVKTSGPTGGTPASPSTATTLINSLVIGTYVYTLTVTDNLGSTGTDTVIVTVVPAYTPHYKQELSIKKIF